MDWMMLKSGSDVRGTAVGEGTVLTEDVAYALGAAFVRKLSAEKEKKASEITVSLGRDSRISGPALLAAAAEGIRKAGAVAVDFGMCTTPAMFMSTITDGFRMDGAIMITASHHPWNKNGLKFFTEKAALREARSLNSSGTHSLCMRNPRKKAGSVIFLSFRSI